MAKININEKIKSTDKSTLSKIKLKSVDEVSEFAENIINTVHEPLLLLDKELRVVKASRSFFNFFKVNFDETIGTLIYNLGNHQWDIPKLRDLLETILPEKTTFDNYEVEHDFSAIGKRIMLLNARQIKKTLGKEQIILLAIEDITDKKKTETYLEKTTKERVVIGKSADEASEFAENIINTVREPLLVLDKKLRVVKASRSFFDFFKVNSDETIGKLIYDLGNRQWDIPILRELLEKILPEKTTFDNYEVKHDFSVIGKRIMLLNARQIKRALGKEGIILLAFQDITGRKFAEESLISSEIRYRRLFETAKDGILILDAETGKIIDVNPFLIELLGYTKESIIEKEIWEFGFFKDIATNKEKFLELQQKGYVRYEDLPLETIDGRKIDVEFVSNTYLVNQNKIVQCNIRDITERKRVEQIIQLRNHQLSELNATKDKLFSIIAHDLKSPFQFLLSSTEFLATEIESLSQEEVRLYIEKLGGNLNNLYDLLENLLDWSMMQRNMIDYKPENLVLNDLVKKVIGMSTQNAVKKNISIFNKINSGAVVYADINMLHSVVQNLIINAIKFTHSGGQIIVSSTDKNDFIEVSVNDNGIGIESEKFIELFNFNRIYSTNGTNGEKGTGLGLPLCKEFVERNGGKIWIESEVGKGSTFFFTLPGKN